LSCKRLVSSSPLFLFLRTRHCFLNFCLALVNVIEH
jgi:hypothetical protein